MRPNSTYAAGRRTRRNPRRRPDSRDAAPTETQAKPTMWQKIVAFFTGSSKKSESSSKSTSQDYSSSSSSSYQRTSRRPENVDVTTPRLYVGNLSFDATENDLTNLFNGVGQVVSAEVVSHRHTQRSKGFAFVQMQSVDEALRAVRELHDKEFLGRKLVVSGAKSHESRRESDPDLAS